MENTLHQLFPLFGAFLLTLPLAWDRADPSGPGLRTFPLVAISSCAYLLLAQKAMSGFPEAQARVLQGVITGMGFVGGGAILKHDQKVSGLADATSLWATGAIGAACAFNYYQLALVISLAALFSLRFKGAVRSLDRD